LQEAGFAPKRDPRLSRALDAFGNFGGGEAGEKAAAEDGNARAALQAAMQSPPAISNASRRGTEGKCPEGPDDADAGPA
jgi:hypothetical protein